MPGGNTLFETSRLQLHGRPCLACRKRPLGLRHGRRKCARNPPKTTDADVEGMDSVEWASSARQDTTGSQKVRRVVIRRRTLVVPKVVITVKSAPAMA